MRCPVCSSMEQVETTLHSDGFNEGIIECTICGTSWAVNHGVVEIVNDAQVDSFLQAQSECVEGDDYSLPKDDAI